MKTFRSDLLLITCVAAMGMGACSHQSPDSLTGQVAAAPPATESPGAPELLVAMTPSEPDPAEKTYAPVDLRLTSSARAGLADVVLTVTPRTDVPSLRLRIVLPAGVELVSGASESELGPLAKGQKGSLALRVRIPGEGSFAIAGGAEVDYTPSHKVARSTVLDVGAPRKQHEAPVVPLPEGGSVRVQQ